MAGDHNAGTAVGHGYLPELGLCIIEQLIPLSRLGNEDFQTLDGLNTHDKQLPCDVCHAIVNILT